MNPTRPSDQPNPAPAGPTGQKAVARTLLFGGTFDPPHRAHMAMALRSREAWEREANAPVRILIVPAARSPHKDDAPRASDDERLAMLALAWKDALHATIWPGELERARVTSGPSYTIDTVRELAAPGSELALLIGSDQAGAFHRWREARELFARARPWVVPRGEVRDRAALRRALEAANFWTREELDLWPARWVDAPIDPASSTLVRAELAKREPDRALLESLLGAKVSQFILTRGLYRAR
ncbi:MAG: nicotinate-nicotinamide nucleotide adenylyltransferase [Planctomycetota bacterium]|nr:nicotinate-nicotinamide nucleotide adenylyltransferase [Planctomycetota bacterium]